jgi:hypothetical protein
MKPECSVYIYIWLLWRNSAVVHAQQSIWKFTGNRFFESHIRDNEATETELLEAGISFAPPPLPVAA